MHDAVAHLWHHLDATEKNLVDLRMKGFSTAESPQLALLMQTQSGIA